MLDYLHPFVHTAVLTVMPALLTPFQSAMLTITSCHPHSIPTGLADRYDESCSVHSNRPPVLTVMPAPPHSLPTGRADCYARPSSLLSNRPCCSYAGASTITSNRPCSQLCRIIITQHQRPVLTVIPDPPHPLHTSRAGRFCQTILIPLQPAVLTVMPTPPHSLSTGSADRYAGPSSLRFNRPC